jgi:glycosyltransferase involved in cell wall biosynthesis
MRVVLDARIVLPRMTGAGRYVIELARRIPGLADDLTLEALLLPAMRQTQIPVMLADAGVSVHYVSASVASIRQWFVLPQVLRRIQPDLYHYPFLDLPYSSCPSVVTIYDLNPLLHAEYFDHLRIVKRAVARALVASTMRRSRAVIAISGATANLLRERYPDSSSKVRTIPLGVDPPAWAGTTSRNAEPFVSPDEAIRREHPWQSRGYALYVGVDRPHKNLAVLVRAFGRFRSLNRWQGGVGPYLWLAGVGPGSPNLRAEVTRLALGKDVRLGPALAEGDLKAAYSGATVVTYVSTSEGFGLPLLEAFAAGVPVLAAQASSLPEVGGDAALYADPHDEVAMADTLSRIWGDRDLRRTLVDRGRQRITQFSWDETAAATVKVYCDALGHGTRARADEPSG